MPLEDEPEEVDLADLADPDQGSLGAEVNDFCSTSQCFAGFSTAATSHGAGSAYPRLFFREARRAKPQQVCILPCRVARDASGSHLPACPGHMVLASDSLLSLTGTWAVHEHPRASNRMHMQVSL